MKRLLVIIGLFAHSYMVSASDVPYYFQYDNLKEGPRACNITSMAMVLDYLQITKPESGARTPDTLYERFGIRQEPEDLAAVFNITAREAGSDFRDNFKDKATIAELRELASKGIPTVIHGWFTKSGHIVVVTGFDGTHYTVNDPAGVWNLKKYGKGKYDTMQSGLGVRYPAEAFDHAINDNGTGDDLWLHIFEKQ